MASRVHTILAADSRARPFLEREACNSSIYQSHLVVCPGAKVDKIKQKTIQKLSNIPQGDLVLIRIAGGINELTLREYHVGGVELCLQRPQYLIHNLLKFKDEIKSAHPISLVSFATIPIINFVAAQKHYIDTGKLWQPKYSYQQLTAFQTELSDSLANINTRLIVENRKLQYVPGWATTSCSQLYWHQDIEKLAKRKRGGKWINVKRIRWTALPDGVHPSSGIAKTWYNRVHDNFKKDYMNLITAPILPP